MIGTILELIKKFLGVKDILVVAKISFLVVYITAKIALFASIINFIIYTYNTILEFKDSFYSSLSTQSSCDILSMIFDFLNLFGVIDSLHIGLTLFLSAMSAYLLHLLALQILRFKKDIVSSLNYIG